MKHFLRRTLLALAFLALAPALLAQADLAGSKDYPGITRMPDTFIRAYAYSKFDSFAFPITQGKKEVSQDVEGPKYYIGYKIKNGITPGSALETVRNYQNAVRAKGGDVLYEYAAGENRRTTLRFRKDSREVWIHINAYRVDYEMTVVEKQVMEQKVAVDAAAMASDIAQSGRVAIYGIFFDTAKSDLKPESAPAIEQIVKLLADNPSLKVGIVGHTDMVGEAAGNIRLSQARAQSVIADLVKRGVAASRVVPFGAGPWAPVASNKTDEGRARNRRVELVEIATK